MARKSNIVKFGGAGRGRKRTPPPPPPPTDRMNRLFDMSLDVIEEELSAGSARMACWMAENYFKYENRRLRARIQMSIENPRELEEASKAVVMAAAEGVITFDECKELQEALARHAVLSGMRDIEDLQTRINDMSEANKKKRMGGLNGHTPTWGGLSEKK